MVKAHNGIVNNGVCNASDLFVNGVYDHFVYAGITRNAKDCTASEWLSERCRYLERLVEPHLSKRATGSLIRFKGRKRYIKLSDHPSADSKIKHAMMALQHLYHTQAALKAGNVDLAIMMAMSLGSEDQLLISSINWNVDAGYATIHYLHSKHVAEQRGKKTKLLTNSVNLVLETSYANHKGVKSPFLRIAEDLYRQGIKGRGGKRMSPKTVERRLKKLGFLDSVDVVHGQR